VASVYDLFTYGVELNWRLMWFPIRSEAVLKEVQARTNSIRLRRSDLPPPDVDIVHSSGFDLGEGKSDGDPLGYPPNYVVVAFVSIGTGISGLLESDLELRLGRADTKSKVTIDPGARVPFMLSVQARADDGDVANTAAVVDGVFNAGSRVFSGVGAPYGRP
jgi:hypothetical protein